MNISGDNTNNNDPPMHKSPEDFLKISGIDVKSALVRLNVDMGIFIRSLEAFADNYSDFIEVFKNTRDNKNTEESRNLLHTLRGSATNLGMHDVEEAAAKLGNAVKSGEQELSIQLSHLESGLNKVLTAIHRLTKEH